MDKSIGLVTLGQSSRIEIIESLNFPSDIRIEFIGALDGVSEEEVSNLVWKEGDEDLTLFTKYNGENIVLGKNKLVPYLQRAIDKVESKVSITTIICTESFPGIIHKKPHFKIDRMLLNLSKSIAYSTHNSSFGIFIPDPNKVIASETRWDMEGDARTVFLRPYSTEAEIREACKLLREKIESPQYLILDCMGFSTRDIEILQEEFNSIIICPMHFFRNHIIALFNG